MFDAAAWTDGSIGFCAFAVREPHVGSPRSARSISKNSLMRTSSPGNPTVLFGLNPGFDLFAFNTFNISLRRRTRASMFWGSVKFSITYFILYRAESQLGFLVRIVI